jgi:hypothetical protein
VSWRGVKGCDHPLTTQVAELCKEGGLVGRDGKVVRGRPRRFPPLSDGAWRWGGLTD